MSATELPTAAVAANDPPATASRPAVEVAVFAPALLLLVEIHGADDDDNPEIHLHAGGQGYWVAHMIRSLGAKPVLCAAAGGESGAALEGILAAQPISLELTPTEHPNAVIIDDRRGDERVELAAAVVPRLGRHEADEIYSAMVGAGLRAGVGVIAGTQLSNSINDDMFRRLVGDLRTNGVHVVVDLSGEPLRASLEAGVDVVKISDEELCSDEWAPSSDVDGLVAGIEALRKAGADAVVVSRGAEPTIATLDGRLVEVTAPSLESVDARGGGDSMTAALAVATARGEPFEAALRLAVAAGALNVTRHGLGSGRLATIEELASRSTVTDLERPKAATARRRSRPSTRRPRSG